MGGFKTHTVDLQNLFELAFGYTKPIYTPSIDSKSSELNAPKFSGITLKPQPEIERLSWLGTPIMFPTQFKGGNYMHYATDGSIERRELEDMWLPAATLIDFTRAKNIIKTRVLGDTGSVKELFGFDDWRIRIRGLCLREPGVSAIEQLEQILEWEKVVDAIEVSGDLFAQKDIFKIVIEEIDIPQPQGKPNVIPFTLTCVSDKPLELEVL